MNDTLRGLLIAGILILVIAFILGFRRTINEKYALVWFVVGGGLILFGLVPEFLARISGGLGFNLTSNFLLVVTSAFLALMVLQLAATVGRLEQQVRHLGEALALLAYEQRNSPAPIVSEPGDAGGNPEPGGAPAGGAPAVAGADAGAGLTSLTTPERR
ncbi:MAG: DUF2304 family protein [Actinomycetales bacterium]|nr:DUF2304 family protein [Actinomycetales bacterium]